MVRIFTISLLLLTAGLCLAQGQAPPVYDLAAVVKTALDRYPSLQMGAEQVNAAQAQVRQVEAHFRPQINAEGGYTRLEEAPSFTVASLGTIRFGEKDNWTANLSLQYPLSTGGKLEGMKAGAEAGLRASEGDLARQRQTVAVTAARAYFRLLEANRMVPVISDQVQALEAVLRSAVAMSQQGVVAKIDVMRAQVALIGARESLQELQADREAAEAMLVEAMGLPPGSVVQIAESKTPEPTVPPAEPWLIAWKQRPDLLALAAQKRAAQAQVAIARAALRPQVGLFARSDFARPTFMPDMGTLSAGVMIEQEVFDGGAAHQAVRAAEAQVRQLTAAEAQARGGVAAEVQVAISGLTSARARVDTTAPAVAVAREALRLAQVGYTNGVTPLTDVLQAQAALTKANADYEGALSALRQAYAEYDYAMGNPVGGAGTPAH